MPDCHAFVSYFRVFQMSTISKLGCMTHFDMLFLVMGFTWLMKLISSRQICIRSINHVVIRLHFWGNLVPRALRMRRPEVFLKERKSVVPPQSFTAAKLTWEGRKESKGSGDSTWRVQELGGF